MFVAVPFDHKPGTFETVMAYRRLGDIAAACATKNKLGRIVVLGNDIALDDDTNLAAMVEAVALAGYDFTECLSKKPDAHEIEALQIHGCEFTQSAADAAIATADGIMLSRTLSLLPPRRKHPMDYAARVEDELASFSDRLTVTVIQQDELERMGAGGILHVNAGSAWPAAVLKIVYTPPGGSTETPIAFIGKGVLFDTGGYSLKPPAMQPDMKGDCGGGNTVVGAMLSIAAVGPNVPFVAYVPLVENRIDGEATMPSDVFTSLSGQTVEDLNTDAEGRLILQDVITLAQRDGSKKLVDLATFDRRVHGRPRAHLHRRVQQR